MQSLPCCSPASIIIIVHSTNIFNRFHVSTLATHHRNRRNKDDSFLFFSRLSSIRVSTKESKLKKMVRLMSNMGAGKGNHDTESEAVNGGKEILVVHDNGPQGRSINGSVVALGKFDALHIGHRALAVQASKMGAPVLLSFAGMAEVLRWEKRLPIVAPCDRKRVMSLWSTFCGGKVPEEYKLEFSKVRSLSPHDFVEKLAKELHVKGVVAGANYRFGYKAAGDASDLTQLCGKFGLDIFIVDPVMDIDMEMQNDIPKELEAANNNREKGQVSSTRVRKALSAGKMRRVTELLGRDHRLVFMIDDCIFGSDTIRVPISKALNQVPGNGIYTSRIFLSFDGILETKIVGWMDVNVVIGNEHVAVTINEETFNKSDWSGQTFLCLDVQCKSSSLLKPA